MRACAEASGDDHHYDDDSTGRLLHLHSARQL